MTLEIDRDTYQALVDTLRRGIERLQGQPAEETWTNVATAVTRALWSGAISNDGSAISGYDIDGVVVDGLDQDRGGAIVAAGHLHLTDWRGSWPTVPFRVSVRREEEDVVLLQLGDGRFTSLSSHSSTRLPRVPVVFLLEVTLKPANENLPARSDEVLASLRRWCAEHQAGQIVGPDWQTLTLQQAERLIIQSGIASQDHLQTTWLDGAEALRIAWLSK